MRGVALTLAILALAGCSAPSPAPLAASSPASPPLSPADSARIKGVLEEAGLIGVWGVDCDGPLDSPEWETIGVAADGSPQTTLGGGAQSTDFRIVDASRTAPGEVKAKVETDDRHLVIVYRIEGDRQMTWSSSIEGGEALITDGVSISGRQSAWYNRCPNGLPGS